MRSSEKEGRSQPYPRERTWADAEAELVQAKAEIERLRDDLVIANTTQANLHSEIDRLRELLREAHLALSFMPDPTRKLLDLRYRVREALGE